MNYPFKLTKAAFIWLKYNKQEYGEILLQFKIKQSWIFSGHYSNPQHHMNNVEFLLLNISVESQFNISLAAE